jgi:N,N'-diacetyllegionaminate synthase
MNLADYAHQERTFIIAEIGQAHDGSLGILHSLIDAVASTGVDAIKFQVHIAEAESSRSEPFRVKFSPVDATRFDYWKRMELSPSQWREIKNRCENLGVEFLATPFSNAAVDLLEVLSVVRYKVGSGDLANPLLLEKLARTGKEIILSTGLCTDEEIDTAVAFLRERKVPFALMQCTTKYPTTAPDIGLARICQLRERYGCSVGLSDHSGVIYAGLGAVALGATAIEAHVTFDKRMFGPDALASLTIEEFVELVRGARFLELARGEGTNKENDDNKLTLRRTFGRALAVNRDMKAGSVVNFDDLEGKKTSDEGISVTRLSSVVGRRLVGDRRRGDLLLDEHFE